MAILALPLWQQPETGRDRTRATHGPTPPHGVHAHSSCDPGGNLIFGSTASKFNHIDPIGSRLHRYCVPRLSSNGSPAEYFAAPDRPQNAAIYCIIYVCCVSSTSSISDRLCRGFPERMLCKIDPYPGHSVNRATTQHVETGGGHNVQISQSSRRGKSQSPTPGSGRRNRSCYVGVTQILTRAIQLAPRPRAARRRSRSSAGP